MKRATVLMDTFAQFKLLVVKAVDEQKRGQHKDAPLSPETSTDLS